MPRVIRPVDISREEMEERRDYFDRHTPHVVCEGKAVKGEKFMVKVRIGEQYTHPDQSDHYIKYIQLWNLETFVAEVQFAPLAQGGVQAQQEVDFFLYPRHTLRLTAMSACTKHGLWQSREVVVPVEGAEDEA